MLSTQDEARLDALYDSMKRANDNFLGYPFAKNFDYSALWRFMDLTGNNLGDPFDEGIYRVDSREFERDVVEFFATHFRAPVDDYWGYVTTGGTEGNTFGLYLGRELYPNGVAYFSRDTHYSVSKGVRLLKLPYAIVRSDAHGQIDYEDLKRQASAHPWQPAIVVANIGTTMKEGRDDVGKIKAALAEAGVRDVYVHSDAALCGPYAPFIDPRPVFDFADGADSITISGHKFIGAPMPCGVVVTRKYHVQRITRAIDYIGSLDSTLGGSRSAFAPILLWYALRTLGLDGLRSSFEQCEALAAYAVATLTERGVDAWRNAAALTVVFPPVRDEVRAKWQLASQDVSHLIVTPGTTKEQVDALISAMTLTTEPVPGG